VRHATGRSDRVRKSRLRSTAVDRPVSERDGDVGSGPSGRATPTTARTRRGRSARGLKAIATIGASIGAHIPSTARAIALRRDSGGAGCKDGRVKGGFARTIRDLSAGAGACRRVCKDGRVDCGNDFDIKTIRESSGGLQRDDVIGVGGLSC
jgi:hypothetical protein